MRNLYLLFVVCLFCLLLLPVTNFASGFLQEAVVTTTTLPANTTPLTAPPGTLQQFLIVFVTALIPVIVWGMKKTLTFLPKWALPIIAMVIGTAVFPLLTQLSVSNAMWGTVLGAAAVGLREFVDQLRKVGSA